MFFFEIVNERFEVRLKTKAETWAYTQILKENCKDDLLNDIFVIMLYVLIAV